MGAVAAGAGTKEFKFENEMVEVVNVKYLLQKQLRHTVQVKTVES